jgi:hypothetical protein
MRLICILITSILLNGCINFERKDKISYDSYGEAYEKANLECNENPRFSNKSLAECLKTMDFQESFAPPVDSVNTDAGSTAGDEYGE